mgnify:FL=1
MNNERYGIFYLKTGGGHFSGAKSIAEKLKTLQPEAHFSMHDGLDGCINFFRFFLETGYSVTANYLPLWYICFYQVTQIKLVQKLCNRLFSPFLSLHVRKQIVKGKFTKIICTHEILMPIIKRICNELHINIPIICIVMDPFTAHSLWFFEKDVNFIVFSEYLKKVAIQKYSVLPENIFVAQPIFSEKFNIPLSDAKKQNVKNTLSIPHDKKILLIAGGGEGLKNADKILKTLLQNNFSEYVIIVCGKNKVLKQRLEKITAKYKAQNVRIFGFVNIMYELINISDCVVSKGGPGTVMEVLTLKKPLIIPDFIRYQEWGNVFFVKQNNAGFLISEPNAVHKKVTELFTNAEHHTTTCSVTNGLAMSAEYILKL